MKKNGSPLHHAAARGDFNLAQHIYEKTPQLAEATDNRGRLALHLAAARGYVEIVRLLVSNDDLDTCSARDVDGRNPLHLAAMNGKVEALNVLVEKCPHAAKARAGRGETILHICFEFNHKEELKFLLQNAKVQELINAKDNDGNTLLHLAVADQNATPTNKEIVKSLFACPNIDANATNSHKKTPLDIAIKREKILKKLKLDKKVAVSLVNSLREEDARTTKELAKELGRNNWVAEKRGSLMVVASLIATMAFQAGLTPPGGLLQNNEDLHQPPPGGNAGLTPPGGLLQNNEDLHQPPPGGLLQNNEDLHIEGQSLLAARNRTVFSIFLIPNTTALLGSLSVILLLISELPFKNKFFMWVLTVIMWGTITAIACTYGIVVAAVSVRDVRDATLKDVPTITLVFGVFIWVSIMGILLLIHTIRICLRLTKVRKFKIFIRKSMKKLGFRKRNTLRPGNGASAQPV